MKNLKNIAIVFAVIFSFFNPALASALSLNEARQLALAGDIDRIEEQFRLHQEEYDSSRIDAEAFKEPYKAFNSTHPKIYQTTQQWLDKYPTSASALAARGGQLVYRADLIREPHTPGTLPKAALAKIAALADQAIPMLDAALATTANHLPAAHSLNLIGAILRRPEARLRALEVIKKHDDPDSALLAEIRFVDLSWRPESGAAHLFCSNRVEAAPNINLRQCIAAVELEQDNIQFPDMRDAQAVLLNAPGSLFPLAHAYEKYFADPEAAFAFMKSMGGVSWRIAEGLAYSLEPKLVLDELVLPQLEIDPLNPGWLMVLSSIRGLQNDPAAAWDAVERAMELGAHHPRVSYTKIVLMERHQDLRWNAVKELKDAFEAADGDIVLVDRLVRSFLSPEEYMLFNKNGSPNQDFQCVRLMYLERHKAWCKANPEGKPPGLGGRTNCGGSVGTGRDKIITSTRLQESCGQSVTWKDWFRYLLDQTE